jgi:hypothetical protein
MWYLSTMDYYSATKRNEILSFETTFEIKLEITWLCEMSQAQKEKYHRISPMGER